MALAVVNAAGIEECDAGSETDAIKAALATGITLDGNTASTILDCNPVPDFGDCIIWAILTAGSQTDCQPAVIPVWNVGVSAVFWELILANGDEDTAVCTIGGSISIPVAGTDIVII